MSNRYMTKVICNGETKICKYSKYDGDTAADEILGFFKTVNINQFKKKVENLSFSTVDYVESLAKDIGVQYNRENDSFTDYVSAEKFFDTYQEYAFRTSIFQLLDLINRGIVTAVPNHEFINERCLFYQFTIDLDKSILIIYDYGSATGKTVKLQPSKNIYYSTDKGGYHVWNVNHDDKTFVHYQAYNMRSLLTTCLTAVNAKFDDVLTSLPYDEIINIIKDYKEIEPEEQ